MRHWIPAAFVVGLLGSLLLGLILKPFLVLSLGILGIYTFAIILVSLQMGSQKGWQYAWLLPFLFFLTHMTYGSATLAGIMRFGVLGVPPKLPMAEPVPHPIMQDQQFTI